MVFVMYVLVGIAGGMIGGVFGVGGGVIIVPALFLGFGFTQHMAQGTMLATLEQAYGHPVDTEFTEANQGFAVIRVKRAYHRLYFSFDLSSS